MQLSYFKFVAGFNQLLTFSIWNLYIYAFACSQHEFIKLSMQSENMFTSLEKKCLYLFICMTCMPKIKYIRYRVVHVYTLSNHDNYNISILDYENLAFHF